MFDIPLQDTFIQGLYTIIKQLDNKNSRQSISPSYLFGRTGHGVRFSLAMNTKTGKKIGHPSGHYSWDIVGVVEQCFPDTGIDCTLYVGPGYATRARKTAAQSERELTDRVVLLDDYVFAPSEPLIGQLLYATHKGEWKVARSSDEIEVEWDRLPFGPVILDIHGFEEQHGFPLSTFSYLVDTIERGEEPMEIAGRGNYSTVSGWKAFARWMQSFSMPLPDVQHNLLSNQASLLVERRKYFIEFLEDLKEEVSETEGKLLEGLKVRYQFAYDTMIKHFEEKNPEEIKLSDVRTCYFAEQKTLTFYKKIDTYLTYHHS